MLGALELVSDKAAKTPFEPALAISDRLFRAGYDNGIIFRAFADGTIGLAPALSCTEAEMETLLTRLRRTLDNVLETKDIRAAVSIMLGDIASFDLPQWIPKYTFRFFDGRREHYPDAGLGESTPLFSVFCY